MIVTRTMAEDAAKELLVHALFLQGITPEQVGEAYRSRARETHPDAGGTAEEFAAVDRAKHVLLRWLEKGEVAQPLHKQTDCANCAGRGHVTIQRAFKQMRVMCITCRGTGDADYDPDKTDTGVNR